MPRLLWIACLVIGLLVAAQDAQAKGKGGRNKGNNNPNNPTNPNNPRQNQNPNNSNPNQPTTQPFGPSGSNSEAAADRKQLETDKAALATAEKHLNEVVAKLKSDFASSPERKETLKAVSDAQADFAAQRSRVLESVQNTAAYKSALADRDRAGSQLASEGVPEADRATLAAHRLAAGNTVAQLETNSIASDPKASESQRKLADLQAKSAAQSAQFQSSLQSDPKWTDANDAITKGKAAVAADEKKLNQDLTKAKMPKDPNAI